MVNLNLKALIDRLNPAVRDALEGAAGLCMARGQFNVEIEHWLLKLMEVPDSDMQALFERYELDPARLARDLTQVLDRVKTGNTRAPALAPGVVELAKQAWMIASVEHGVAQASSGHVLAALLLDDNLRRQATESSAALGQIAPESLREMVRAVHGTTHESMPEQGSADDDNGGKRTAHPSKHPALDQYTVNLTQRAQDGHIDPVLGRDQEIRQIIDILTRRRQNNPILTGEAGVGKTAVVEGLALRIAAGDVPPPLREVDIHVLDLGLLQAGASVKGEFENRLKSVINEVKASSRPIIMFIDEAHTMIGAGGKEGQGDAANLLKPALARGELRTIAATTWAEYKKYFERDPALTRRFQVVKVEEPDEETAIDMMRGIAKSLEKHHRVRILDEAIVESVRLSKRYLPGRQLPDKSVSLLDTAAARVQLSQSATPADIEDTRRRIEQYNSAMEMLEREHAASGQNHDRLEELRVLCEQASSHLKTQEQQWEEEKTLVAEIREIHDQIDADFLARREGSEDHAATLDDEALKALRVRLDDLTAKLTEIQGETPLMSAQVDGQAVAEVIANWTGIPVGRMLTDQIQSVLSLKSRMQERVIGQDHALEAIAQSIRTSRAGLTDPRKPIGVFLMVGPSGVGKTETAMALADLLYGGEQNITVINMSEFKEEHKVSMLVGSPPGYIGYGEGGVLTEAVRRNPYSVILLDEMEKAHPGVQDVFYQVFDKGNIRDGEGRDIDFRNTVIIMTSNAGEETIRKIVDTEETLPEPETLFEMFRPALLRHFKPAFLGRAQIIPYYPLDDDKLIRISQINLSRIANRVKSRYGADFSYDEDVIVQIVARSQEVDTGARNIENIVNRTLLPELATECLSRMTDADAIQKVHVGVESDGRFHYAVS